MRLIELEDDTKELLDSRALDMGHARALLALTGIEQTATAHLIAKKGMSVRETERLIKKMLSTEPKTEKKTPAKALEVQKLEEDLSQKLGAKVAIQYNTKGKGKLVVEYNNLDELDGILEHIK